MQQKTKKERKTKWAKNKIRKKLKKQYQKKQMYTTT